MIFNLILILYTTVKSNGKLSFKSYLTLLYCSDIVIILIVSTYVLK